MDPIRNERGGATLLYVVMVAMILMLISPLILSVAANEAERDKRDSNAIIANTLAVSVIDSFIAYLDAYEKEDGLREDYFYDYSGFTNQQYSLPDGTAISLEFQPGAPSEEKEIPVTVTVTANGDHRLHGKKTLTYTINVSEPPVDTEPPVEPGRSVVPKNHNKVYLQGCPSSQRPRIPVPGNLTYEPEGDGRCKDSTEDDFHFRTDVVSTIAHLMNDQVKLANEEMRKFEKNAESCNCNNIAELEERIQNSKKNPVILSTNSLTIDDERTYVWGTAEKPVILLMGGLNYNRSSTINITGNLIFTGDGKVQNDTNLNVYAVGDEYGNIYANHGFTIQNSTVHADNKVYTASNFIVEGTSFVDMHDLYVKGEFQGKNNATVNVDRDMIMSTFILNDSPVVTTGGDFLVHTNFKANGKADLTIGGLVAVGGGEFQNSTSVSTVYSGGGTTQLDFVESTPPPPGTKPDADFEGWNPTRR
ncbi:hypothetical protein MO973_20075 [Paenibacillus sp. TRM 82003]|nr:hypothetical protein [Paenibacillus sp. TRM 82003]